MCNRVASLLIACAMAVVLVTTELSSAPLPAERVPPDIAEAARTYANALAGGDLQAAWDLLSSESRSYVTAPGWERAFAGRPSVPKPPPNTLLKAVTAAPTPPTVVDVLVRADEALIHVGGTLQVTQQIVLVRESDGWRVDLAASDRLNSREAGQVFLDAVREETNPGALRRPGAPSSTPSLLRALLGPHAKDYRVLEADIEQDRAQVTVAADVPVSLVLRGFRSGPGWTVDLSRPVLSVDATSADPLGDAVGAADKSACEDHLRQLAKAIQMYAAASDDMFPDPDRWLDQIRTYLPHPPGVHCPADPIEGVSYAMNRNLAGKRRREVGTQAATALLFESTLHTENPADAGASWTAEPRHPGGSFVAFVDGSVRPSPRKPSFTVVEAPPGGRSRAVPTRPPVRVPPRPAP
jgi:prepilin-type processing-associated H-X9-DG protein